MFKVIIRTLSRELRLHTDSQEAFAALSYASADPIMADRSLTPVELPVEQVDSFYRLRPADRDPVEGSLDSILNGIFRLLSTWMVQDSHDTPIFHAAVAAIGGKRIAILGDKGFGKTTLMLKLIEQGASVEGDEHVVITPGGAITRPRRLHVKESSLDLVPALSDSIRASPSTMDWMGNRVFACSPSFYAKLWEIAERPIDHVVFAEPNFGGTSILSPVSRDAAFGQMLEAAFMPSQSRGKAAASLRTLSIKAQAWRLQVGKLDQAAWHLQKITGYD
ncbi:MAG: hypothetical protein ABJB10_03135 [Mesorhizobium sp.]